MGDDLALYWSLFQGEFPDEWKSDPDFLQYLTQLGAYSAEKLQLEPEYLAEERRCVLNSTQKLAFNNYKTFIETAECTREVFKDFVSVEEHVGRVLEKVPGLVAACKSFTQEAQEVNAKRKLNSLALSRHTNLLEVLEIPQVMETCVRNGYYEEALELSAHMRRVDKKHGGIPIVKAIARDVESSMTLMLSQLLQQLRGSIQLPACLRVVGFLRRMEVFSDTELRLKFLQARDHWLQSVLGAIPSDDPYHHISKTIEASRVHLFDIVTQYRAIFPDDDSILSSYSSSSGSSYVEGALFYSWVNEKVWQFLHTLEGDLRRGVGMRLDSLLGQCMYFGLSFSRIGTDFRCLIAPIFVRVIVGNFRLTVRNAKHSFHEAMKKLTLVTPLRGLSSSLPTYVSTSTQSLTPPHSLLDYPPLAVLTNTLIQAFNDLRQCAPLALGPEISQELRRLLESVVHDIGEYHKVEHTSFTEKESEAFMQLSRVTVEDFLPFIKKCFDAVFSESAIEQLALSTPYALRHCKNHKQEETGSVSVLQGLKPSVDLRMELNVKSIAEVLRTVVPEVFDEMERQSSLSTLNLDVESLLSSSANQPVLVGTQDEASNLITASQPNPTLAGTDSSEWRTGSSQDNLHHWTQAIDHDSKPAELELQSGLPVAGTDTSIGKSNSQHEVPNSYAPAIKTELASPGVSLPGREDTEETLTSSGTGVASSMSPEILRTSDLTSC